MNRIYLIILVLSLNVYSQDTLFITQNKFLTIHFPKEVTFYQTSALMDESLGINTVGNSMFIQSFEEIEETNIAVKTIDNKYYNFIINYRDDITELEKTIESSLEDIAIEKAVKELARIEELEQKKAFKEMYDLILNDNGYLRTRNYAIKDKISILLKGTYYKDQKLYLYFELDNKTKIDFIIERLNFFVVNKKGITKSESKNLIEALDIYSPTDDINNLLGKKEIIFVIDKFTLNNDKKLLLEIIESQGERNIEFDISSSIINNSKTI